MSRTRETAETYRVHAEEIRAIAEMDDHRETRQMLEQVARDYELMATSMDRIAATQEAIRRF